MNPTKQDLNRLLSRYPELSYFGWGVYDQRSKTKAEIDTELKSLRDELISDHAIAQIDRCREWMEPIGKVKAISEAHSSYGLKHKVERHYRDSIDDAYIANGAFVAAALLCGFKERRVKPGSPNSHFNMSARDINRLAASQADD